MTSLLDLASFADTVLRFLRLAAWMFSWGAGLLLLQRTFCVLSYLGSQEQLLDSPEGKTRRAGLIPPLCILLLCIAWLVASGSSAQ